MPLFLKMQIFYYGPPVGWVCVMSVEIVWISEKSCCSWNNQWLLVTFYPFLSEAVKQQRYGCINTCTTLTLTVWWIAHAQVWCLSKLSLSLHPLVCNCFLVPFKISGWVSSHWWCHSLLADPDSEAYTICQRMGLLHCCLWNCILCLYLLLRGGRGFGAPYPQASVLHQHLEHPGCGCHSGEDPCTLFWGEQWQRGMRAKINEGMWKLV